MSNTTDNQAHGEQRTRSGAASQFGAAHGYPSLRPESAGVPTGMEREGSGRSLPPVLDACCGSRAMWMDRKDTRAVFVDCREEEVVCGKESHDWTISVSPDVVADFTTLPFPDESFWHVVFDPPHHTSKHFGTAGSSNAQKYYGILLPGWEDMLAAGFAECFRVLKPGGTLIFKWGSREIPLDRILALTPHKPLYGHKSGKKATTHWVAFLKDVRPDQCASALDKDTPAGRCPNSGPEMADDPAAQAMAHWIAQQKQVDEYIAKQKLTADDDHHAMMNGARIAQSLAGRAAGVGGVGDNATPKEATDNDPSSATAGTCDAERKGNNE